MWNFLLEGETAAQGGDGGMLMTIIMMVVLFAAFYFLGIRPQKKQEREAAAMRDALEVGDEITTIGGIIGEIVSMKEDTITIETSKAGTKIRFLKTAVRSVDVRAADKNAPADDASESESK